MFDGVACEITATTDTSINCTTGPRPTIPGVTGSIATFTMTNTENGNIATNNIFFQYVSLYSDERTWAEFLPVDDEDISIPVGSALLVDVDATAKLDTVIVEGSLIFLPNSVSTHERTFDARIIINRGGLIEMGTEALPYTSKLTVTMHGERYDTTLPIFG